MKLRFTYVAALAVLFTAASPVSATTINYNGADVNMNEVSVGQSGSITNNFSSITVPPFTLLSGSAYGFLPSDTEITFTYTFTNFDGGYLQSYGSYDYTSGGSVLKGNSLSNTSSSTTSAGTKNGISSAPLVFASANLPGLSGTTTIANTSGGLAQFQSLFTGLFSAGRSVTVTYQVSSVPLPASLPMFGAVIAALFGFSWYNKQRKNNFSA